MAPKRLKKTKNSSKTSSKPKLSNSGSSNYKTSNVPSSKMHNKYNLGEDLNAKSQNMISKSNSRINYLKSKGFNATTPDNMPTNVKRTYSTAQKSNWSHKDSLIEESSVSTKVINQSKVEYNFNL